MSDETRHAAAGLLRSLEEIDAVTDEQQRDLAAMRTINDAGSSALMDLLQARVSGENLEGAEERKREWMEQIVSDQESAWNRADRWHEQSRRRETAICDAYDALMRLYLDPESRLAAQQTADLLRAIRLLQCVPPEVPRHDISPPLESIFSTSSALPTASAAGQCAPSGESTESTPASPRTERLEHVQSMMQEMDNQLVQITHQFDEQIGREDRYRREALEVARDLCRRLGIEIDAQP